MPYRPPAPTLDAFLGDVDDVLARTDAVDPRAYDRTRNALDGATTWLGPFLTHGITDTVEIAERTLASRRVKSCYRLFFELGWREFFHRTWQLEGEGIFDDLRAAQPAVASERPPRAVLEGTSGIDVVDGCIAHLLEHGTMHNHARLWTAAIACNVGRTDWRAPARWLHHHLLDGDLASNTLSWQWVAGTFSDKRYVANQDNVDRFSKTRQPGSWLDVPYEALDELPLPPPLRERADPDLPVTRPGRPIEPQRGRLALRSIWDLDPRAWAEAERSIVFADTAMLEAWPLAPKRLSFVEHWARACGAELFHGSVEELGRALAGATVVRREHPACEGWPGEVVERRWLYPMPDGEFPSFSRYWKQVRKSVGL